MDDNDEFNNQRAYNEHLEPDQRQNPERPRILEKAWNQESGWPPEQSGSTPTELGQSPGIRPRQSGQWREEYRRIGVKPSYNAESEDEPSIPSIGRKLSEAL
ncbi:hypothetical protein BS47DRAFT_1393198 [Hydnum rufescens UP504]|uniref:Uncharacterized protein n=1 Tax=Hydnum rufescens UP504 TaxID=1448309 RepID=A0A9P6AX53_9AGAM|nr:hypothetical protein BS47DRAFT_1393198 [Hydnum rufescens UP504]